MIKGKQWLGLAYSLGVFTFFKVCCTDVLNNAAKMNGVSIDTTFLSAMNIALSALLYMNFRSALRPIEETYIMTQAQMFVGTFGAETGLAESPAGCILAMQCMARSAAQFFLCEKSDLAGDLEAIGVRPRGGFSR